MPRVAAVGEKYQLSALKYKDDRPELLCCSAQPLRNLPQINLRDMFPTCDKTPKIHLQLLMKWYQGTTENQQPKTHTEILLF